MDPNETLRRIRAEIAARNAADDPLVELFEDLDSWLSAGGFPPQDWTAMRNSTR